MDGMRERYEAVRALLNERTSTRTSSTLESAHDRGAIGRSRRAILCAVSRARCGAMARTRPVHGDL